MGVYGFRVGRWLKVGHYKGANPWSRVSNRGFSSCVCPNEIAHLVSKEQATEFNLEMWYPTCEPKHERKARSGLKCVGEWVEYIQRDHVKSILDSIGANVLITSADKAAAFQNRKRL